ncbi:MAG: HEAT repeat protein [Bradymonadia bacterium]|jgi:HEAT repeat protein
MHLKIRLIPAALAVALLALPSIASAQYAEGVIYSLTPVRLGAQTQYVLVPTPVAQFRPDLPPETSIPAAMGVLRYSAPDRYGQTRAEVVDDGALVRVTIDPIVASQFDYIAAEMVYTFTQLGAQGVEFPGLSDAPMTRADIPYAAYRQQVPLWQATVGGRLHEADVELPGGVRMSADEFFDGLESNDSSVTDSVLQVLRDGQQVEQYGVLTVIGGLGIDRYEADVIPILQHEDVNMRAAALRALQTSGDAAAWDAVLGLMNNDDEASLRDAAALAFATSPIESERFYNVVHRSRGGLVASTDPVQVQESRLAAIAEAQTVTDVRMADALASQIQTLEVPIRDAIVDSLLAMQSWSPLLGIMHDDTNPEDTRMRSALALAGGASGEEQISGLVYRVTNTEGERAKIALLRLHEEVTQADPRESIESFLGHPDINVSVYSSELLAERGDEASLDALSEAATSSTAAEELKIAAESAAFAVLSGLSLEGLESYTRSSSTFLKRASYRALGALAQAGTSPERIFGMLVDGLESGDDDVMGAACRGLGLYADSQALDAIEAILGSASAPVEADCAFALANFNEPIEFVDRAAPWVSGYLDSSSADVVIGGLYATGELGLEGMLGAVLALINSPDNHLIRRYAMEAARKLADPQDPRPVINGISAGLRDDSIDNRVSAVEQLGHFNVPLAVLTLSQVVNDLEPAVRFGAIAAVGATGSQDAVAVLTGLLEDPDQDVRMASVDALRDLGLRSAIPQVEANIPRDPDPVTQALQQGLLEYLQANGN